MKLSHIQSNIEKVAESLLQGEVVAYPTEAVFGLGCNPNDEQAVRKLLELKKRPEEKGLILIAPNVELLLPYIDESQFSDKEWQHFRTLGTQAVTWVMPAKESVPHYLTGKFDSIAVRICQTPAVVALCEKVGFALTSTSANLTGLEPCRTFEEVKQQFGSDFPVLEMATEGRQNPSEIRDIFTQAVFRNG